MTATEQKNYEELHSIMTYMVEREIGNYVLEETEDLYDEKNDMMLRAYRWSRGEKEHWIVLSPFGQIRMTYKDTPKNLIVQLHNIAVEMIMDAVHTETEGC